MKSKFQLIFRLFVAVAIFSSCTETIELELDETYTRLVVDGQISTDTLAHQIRLSKSSSYFSNAEPPAVSGAELLLDDGSQTLSLTEFPEGSGYYYTPYDYFGKPGNTYKLNINLPQAVGDVNNFEATSTMATTAFQLDSISLEYRDRFGFWMVLLYAYDPPTTDFYRLDVFRNGVILTDTASRSTALDDKLFNGNNTNGIRVMFLYEDEVMIGDTITLLMSAISKDYYRFLSELSDESGFSNPLFGGPPANISSNLKEGGLGFFGTKKMARVSMVVDESLWEDRKK
ncbi:MAG: DUF4249 domain-containing protein [Bacteroidales bacterium]|nr:DUF4249 domain-containing protein [Bacteroidales bacterium]